MPEAFINRMEACLQGDALRSALQSFCYKKPTTFRANTLKISADDLAQQLTKQGIEFERMPWYPDAFVLTGPLHEEPNTTKDQLLDTDLYKNGCLYVQSLSSMIPPIVLDPKPGETVLDIAAAPGSKTTQMAAMMENRGEILANDKSYVRVYKLKANLAHQGVTNTIVTQKAGQILWQQYPDYFDKVLVDVPCSMEGRFFTKDPKSYAGWSTKKIKSLVQIQRFLLRSAVSATKRGGRIVYSTCTLAPEENEGIIDWILKKEGKQLDVLPIGHQFPDAVQGITRWNEKQYHPDVVKTLRILPSETMEGFYIALLRKRFSNQP